MILLRPHHLLCVFGWRGVGYSPRFAQRFDALVGELKLDPEVSLTLGPDDLCAACPHEGLAGEGTAAGNCGSAGSIDARVLEALGVCSTSSFRALELFGMVKESIDPEDLGRICAGCPWVGRGWCREGLTAFIRDDQQDIPDER